MSKLDGKDLSKEDRIERMKAVLYSRNLDEEKRHLNQGRLKKHSDVVRNNWAHEDEDIDEKSIFMPRVKEGMSGAAKIFLGAFIFFMVSFGVAAFMFVGGSNTISSENVAINIIGPVSVNGGEVLSFEVEIQNQNNSPLESTYLVVEFPNGARDEMDIGNEVKRYRELVGDVVPGQSYKKKVSTVLFGEEGEAKDISVSAEYRVVGSNGLFEKRKNYEVIISSSPVSISVDSLKDVSSGQDFEMGITISSNSSTLIKDLMLNAEFPFGFEYKSASPSPTYRTENWSLGDLKPDSKKTVIIRGKVDGQDGEIRAFKFTVGTADPKDNRIIGIPFFATTEEVAIEKPFLGLELALNGDTTKNYVASSGGSVRADILWTNNSVSKITGAKVIARLKGIAIKRDSIKTEGGFYRSSDDSIVWDQTNTRGFDVLTPGSSGRLSFSFSTIGLAEGVASIHNPEIVLSIGAEGNRIEENQAQENISTALERKIKVSGIVGISAKAFHRGGSLSNTGPLPPRVDQETTYTVTWTLTSASNDIKNTSVSATLPSYVKWLNTVSPSGEDLTYNPVSGEVKWNAGVVEAGAGYGKRVREISFKIGLTPSSSQIGSEPTLISSSKVSGEDSFTGKFVGSETRESLTTDLSTDPGFSNDEAKVNE